MTKKLSECFFVDFDFSPRLFLNRQRRLFSRKQSRKLARSDPITLCRSASKRSDSSSSVEYIKDVFPGSAIWIRMNNKKAETVRGRKINASERKIRCWELLRSWRCVGLLTDEPFVQNKRRTRKITWSQCNIKVPVFLHTKKKM